MRRELVNTARRHWLLLCLALALGAAVSGALSISRPGVFEARSEVLIRAQTLSDTLAGAQASRVDQNRAVATQSKLVTVPAVLKAVRIRLGLPESDEILARRVRVETAANSDLIAVIGRGATGSEAVEIANAFAGAYVEFRGRLDTDALVAARRETTARLDELRRSGAADTAFFQRVLEADSDLRTRILLGGRNAVVVQDASDAVKVSPRPVLAGVVGGLLSGLVVVAGLVVVGRLRGSVTPEELAGVAGATVIGRVPTDARQVPANPLQAVPTARTPLAEAYRGVARALELSNIGGRNRTILVTSCEAGEGKTTTVLSLAAVWAAAGRTVAVVEADLRAPTMARRLGLADRAGLTEVMLGQVPLQAAVAEFEMPRSDSGSVRVLTAGAVPPNPWDFVGGVEIKKMLRELETSHDVILIDAPPWVAGADAFALADASDATLLVARLGRANRKVLASMAQRLHEADIRVCGVLQIGGVRRSRGYGYGYGSEG